MILSKIDAVNQIRFDVALALMDLTKEQLSTVYVFAQRFLYQLKKDHGSLVQAQKNGKEGKVCVAIALQSRESVANKTYNGGFQRLVKAYRKGKFHPNGSKRMIQKAGNLISELGGIVRNSNGGFKVPFYDINIGVLFVICECCEKRLVDEIGFEELPTDFRWLAAEFFQFFGLRYNRLHEGERPMALGDIRHWTRKEFFELYPSIACDLDGLDSEFLAALNRHCLPRPRKPWDECVCVTWDVDFAV